MTKTLRHFGDPRLVTAVLDQMQERHPGGYGILFNTIVSQLSGYYLEFCKSCSATIRPKLLIGLSGGVDSSLVTFLTCSAVGTENVVPITMPARPDDESPRAARLVRDCLGLKDSDSPYVLSIEELVQAEVRAINSLNYPAIQIFETPDQQRFDDKIRIGNLASRTRILMLYDLSRALPARILGTFTKTEYLLGYTAKYGTPMSYDYGVLDEFYKIDVKELAKIGGVPEEIVSATSTTGYYPGQTQEEELGATHEELDVACYLLFTKKVSPSDMETYYGADRGFINHVLELNRSSRHKRTARPPRVVPPQGR